ncbi:hypothetical protein S40285_10535 [Stachybotrys chlorohalonatus IBT 40285]|uniref:Uncharacterized protein n=1 Tax=Stachybotrys chlorohalonatus (strain IBT 40285) TaxID=1283841 RepID=A0A084QIP1_STAC4|nr:hypothetical protein S40285_10535 [Stachybotrys chlorohalonata IBT 40285]
MAANFKPLQANHEYQVELYVNGYSGPKARTRCRSLGTGLAKYPCYAHQVRLEENVIQLSGGKGNGLKLQLLELEGVGEVVEVTNISFL